MESSFEEEEQDLKVTAESDQDEEGCEEHLEPTEGPVHKKVHVSITLFLLHSFYSHFSLYLTMMVLPWPKLFFPV